MRLPQRKHFFKGLPYCAHPGKKLTFWTHRSCWQIIISRWGTPFAIWIPTVCSSSVSQRKPCIERECWPWFHQVTTCCRHRMPYRDWSAVHHCPKSFIGPPATSVQQSWNLGRSRPGYAWQRAVTSILKSRVSSLTCSGMNKRRVCHPQTATTTHGEGVVSATPSLHTTGSKPVNSCRSSSRVPSGIQKTEDQRLKVQDHCSLTASFLPYALVIFVSLLFGFLYLYTACVLFRKTV